MILAVYAVEYTEYEAGWGCRPDGVCFYKDLQTATSMKAKYEAAGSYEEYSRGTVPYLTEVDKSTYDIVQEKGFLWRT